MDHAKGLLILLVVLGTSTVQAASLSPRQVEQISQLAEVVLRENKLPGLSIAVGKHGEIWSAGFGMANLELAVPASDRSKFRTGSIGKWFTAVAALRLAKTGELDLDAPVQRYCAAYPKKPWALSSRQLLAHMAGVRHYHGDNGEKQDTDAEKQALERLVQRERAGQFVRHTDMVKPLEIFKDDPLLFQPGTKVHYSSLGYRLLGCVLEGAAQSPYRKLMRDLVFAPAGMSSIIDDDARLIVPQRVAGYSKDAEGGFVRAEYRDVSENLPAGGWLSTSADLVRFALAIETGKLLQNSSRERMLERPRLNDGSPAPNPMGSPDYYYGLGVMVGPIDASPAQFHTGGQSGATALLFWFPESQLAVAIMTNVDGRAIREKLARQIQQIAAG